MLARHAVHDLGTPPGQHPGAGLPPDERFPGVPCPQVAVRPGSPDQHGTYPAGSLGPTHRAPAWCCPPLTCSPCAGPVLYRARDAGSWTDVQIDSWEGWPTVPLRTSAGHGTATGATTTNTTKTRLNRIAVRRAEAGPAPSRQPARRAGRAPDARIRIYPRLAAVLAR